MEVAMAVSVPKSGIIFWPVGNGDCTTICVDENTIVQVDLNHLEKAKDSDETVYPVIDELIKILPKDDKKPCLSLFVLTHPDNDHCKGFAELLKKIRINEIWFTPRIFREYKKDLSDDAVAFRDEANRRLKLVIKNEGKVNNGDRIRIVGYDDLLKEEEFTGLPKELLTIPGSEITSINGNSTSSKFRAFIQSPFKDDSDGDRNETSLGMQVALFVNKVSAKVLLLGDLAYPIITKIFERSKGDNVAWNVLLAPHHCSKKVMYWKNEDEEEETYKKEIMEAFKKNKQVGSYIIASSYSDFTDGDGDNPPHSKARAQYEKIIDAGHFLCTHERPSKKAPEPIIFELTEKGLTLCKTKNENDTQKSSLSVAVAAARGGSTPPSQQIGFGLK